MACPWKTLFGKSHALASGISWSLNTPFGPGAHSLLCYAHPAYTTLTQEVFAPNGEPSLFMAPDCLETGGL